MNLKQEVTILIVDDDPGHARLIEKNLRRAALANPIERFSDGQEVLDFLFCKTERQRPAEAAYLLLLDIRMPKVDGVEVLRQIKEDTELRKIPVIMLTTTDDPREVSRCHALGCSHYLVKPVDYEKFSETIASLGHFVTMVEVPEVNVQPSPSGA
ncbi:response regulator [Roseimicrobium sp. ORNL1]|uniref:response regulator n=1 Tax=Roseimicrobium sp. ORNL1 TaxID=2711231 RepID=UPI0013E15832|nr:response regulator [Roseimicrobium sp. ORNL1]QIF02356.1 response regulator [Roseimicrobium sp. ORNL1]